MINKRERKYVIAAAVVIALLYFNYNIGLGAYIFLMGYGGYVYIQKGVPEKPKKFKSLYVEDI